MFKAVSVQQVIPCRPGQPITALDLNDQLICFGSISGYVGYKPWNSKQVSYLENFMPEMIRSIQYDKQLDSFLILSGDLEVDKVSINIEQPSIAIERHVLEGRFHNSNICQYSYGMMKQRSAFVFVSYPTQKKQFVLIQPDKMNVWQFTLKDRKFLEYEFKMPDLSVPFDSSHNQILFLVYNPDFTKSLCLWTTEKTQSNQIHKFNPSEQFISHGKLVNKDSVIYAYNNKEVTLFNFQKKQHSVLYKHDHSIVALQLFQDMPTRQPSSPQSYPTVVSVDFESNLKILLGPKNIISMNLKEVQGFKLSREGSIFDMGFPYYIKKLGQRIAITFDEGILIIKTEL